MTSSRNNLQAEMARRGIAHEQLVRRLAEPGRQHTALNVRNKVARGGFAAVLFVHAHRAISRRAVHLDDIA